MHASQRPLSYRKASGNGARKWSGQYNTTAEAAGRCRNNKNPLPKNGKRVLKFEIDS
jgi:hypothetical protein